MWTTAFGRESPMEYTPVFHGEGVSQGRKPDRSVPRENPNNERIYRGRKVSNGIVSVRKHRYYFQPFDTVIYRGNITAVKGVHYDGARVMLENGKSVKPTDLQLIKHTGGWQFLSD